MRIEIPGQDNDSSKDLILRTAQNEAGEYPRKVFVNGVLVVLDHLRGAIELLNELDWDTIE